MRIPLAYLLVGVVCVVATAASAQELTQSAGDKAHETAAPSAVGPAGSTAEGADDGFAQKREAWFLQQRAYPNDLIPPGARWNALQQKEALRSVTASARLAGGARPMSAFASAVWTADGPQPMAFGTGYTPYSGRATSIAINPTMPP